MPTPSGSASTSRSVTPARRCAFAVVRRVFEQDSFADVAFRAEAERAGLDGRERSFAMRLAYGTVQRKLTLDHLIERLTARQAADLDAPVVAALRLGLYQVAYLPGVPDHAAVDASVELAKGRGGGHRLVNAALRRATREANAIVESLPEGTPAQAALRHSHPRWIAELWWTMLGREQALALMRRDNEPPESAVRANTLRVTAPSLAEALTREGVAVRTDDLVPEAVVLEQAYDVHGSAHFERGELMPQSRASMLVARALAPHAGESVLDLCASPGAKTTHIAALMGDDGRVLAVEADERRARAIGANCERLGVRSVEVLVGDARRPQFGSEFDRVLVDPPCSDLGTLQSRPDVRWRKEPRQMDVLCALQREILEAGAAALRPGGRLVYSTCTISRRENEDQIADFLARHPEFSAADLPGPYPPASADGGTFSQTLPHRDDTDGFFIAALRRNG